MSPSAEKHSYSSQAEVGSPAVESEDPFVTDDGNRTADFSNDYVELCMLNDSIVSRSQLKDYICRGDELADYNLLHFVKDTYEAAVSPKDFAPAPVIRVVGRPRNTRSLYKPQHSHSQKLCRVVRPRNHKNLLSIPGSYLPRSDRPESFNFYCASVLALLKPWRKITDLKGHFEDWPDALDAFKAGAGVDASRIISNIQYFHECSDAASKRKDTRTDSFGTEDRRRLTRGQNLTSEEDPDVDVETENNLDVEDVEALLAQLEAGQTSLSAKLHGTEAVMIAEQSGFFSPSTAVNFPRRRSALDDSSVRHERRLRKAEGADISNLLNWKVQLEEMKSSHQRTDAPSHDPGGATVTSQLSIQHIASGVRVLGNPLERRNDEGTPIADTLNFEQRVAYDIVKNSLLDRLNGQEPEQLLMNLQGGPGTGKSQVIKAITELFHVKHSSHMLVRTAYTGIAASVVDGQTLHTLAKIPIKGGDPSQKVIREMATSYENLHFLIIDEISMISKHFFSQLDRIFSRVMDSIERNPRNLPFGGLNVIICGDFHQFPPVATKKNAPLYYPKDEVCDTEHEKIGKDLYDKFQKVVILKQQMRSLDSRWNELLKNARVGNCSPDDLKELRKLILSSPDCPETDFSDPDWSQAVLVTPRHAVRKEWNKAALEQHCRAKQVSLLTCKAQDTVKGRSLTLSERIQVASKRVDENGKTSKGDSGMLPSVVQLAVGMRVMILFNIDTELDIANGARGVVTEIVLHEDEEADTTQDRANLTHIPMYINVKLDRTKAGQLEGLDSLEIPIEPLEKEFKIQMPDGSPRTVTRKQLPITAAYAFTDYRSQGQTIPFVIVDIGKPPTGNITPFNCYVALSRSKGRRSIRLLRDFEDRLFTETPSEELDTEDGRLASLDIAR